MAAPQDSHPESADSVLDELVVRAWELLARGALPPSLKESADPPEGENP